MLYKITISIFDSPKSWYIVIFLCAGHYIYLESSDGLTGDEATLTSPMQQMKSPTTCLDFYFHMYGPHIDKLEIFLLYPPFHVKPIWRRESNQGNKWHHAQVTIEGVSQYQIRFTGTRGIGSKGDIGIDDILIREGPCNIEG